MTESNDSTRAELNHLSIQVARLTNRVYELEQLFTATPPAAAPQRAAAPAPATDARPARPTPPARPAVPPAQRRPAPRPAVSARPPREPVNWSKVAEHAFTARTLAWAGGVATALGIVLLFVMAASRGWVTPEMRIGLGVLASFGLLAGAFELDRRTWRADGILAAGGAGIAGLYATLWASISLYGFISDAVGLPCAAGIAMIAVALAIRIRQEPLAIFGVTAAMIAPTLIAHDVTGAGVLFAFVIACAGLPLYWRYRWEWLVITVWMAAIGQLAPLYLTTAPGGSSAVLAGVCFFCLFTVEALVVTLRPDARERISELGWLLLGTSVSVSFAACFLYGGHRLWHDRHVSGYALLAVAAAYAALALVPALVRRRHRDVEDVLAAFSLAALATATGLLLGGSGMVCGWAAEAIAMVAISERMLRHRGTRRLRLTIASVAYLALATAKAALLTFPSDGHLPKIGAGSTDGVIALAAVVLAGVAVCYGIRFLAPRGLQLIWLVPMLALGYLPVWALEAEIAVIALAALSSALFTYRRSSWMVGWLDDQLAIVAAAGYWTAGLLVSTNFSAPLNPLGLGHFGQREGLVGLAALVAAGCVGTWSLRRPRFPGLEFCALAPAVVFGYLLCEALSQHQAMWAALAVSAVAAACVHLPALRERIGEGPLLATSAGYLGAVLLGLLDVDQAEQAIAHHGQTTGWGTLALAVGVSFVLATAVRDRRLRGYAMWMPAVLAGWLAALVLPGQYPLVAWAGIGVTASAVVIWRPDALAGRIRRQPLRELAALSAALDTLLVLVVYETPHMLFTTNHTPGSGLAAAAASVVALGFAAAAAAVPTRSGEDWRLAGYRVSTAGTIAACAMGLWTLAAALLGAGQMLVTSAAPAAQDIHDRFQQSHVLISISWVMIGLVLVVASLRSGRRAVRIAGIGLLFCALGKLFLYDLAFLTAMARAISFIVTGSILLVAAVLLQRFSPQAKHQTEQQPVQT